MALLEADSLGTGEVLSTHTIHPPGTDVLDELGVGAIRETPHVVLLRAGTPANGARVCRTYTFGGPAIGCGTMGWAAGRYLR